MRNIAIVGGGQAGLMIALGLQKRNYQVTVLTDRTAKQIYEGRVLSSQGMFWSAIRHEEHLGVRYWEQECPKIEAIEFNVAGNDGKRAISFARPSPGPAESLDQRVKISGWMTKFVELGGDLKIGMANVNDLEDLCRSHDLVLVATGKGELGKLFRRDASNSPFDRPMRSLALTYVKNMEALSPSNGMRPCRGLSWSGVPEVGEYFCVNALTTTGLCEIMIFEGIPGGPMDCWDDVTSPDEHLERSKWILQEFFPWEYERCESIELTDHNGILTGRFAPVVREPIVELPSGQIAMGIGDAVVLNDPLTGQGANNAARCARTVFDAIVDHGDEPFDASWMESTFRTYWEQARHVTKWTNSFLDGSIPEGAQIVLGAAQRNDRIADLIFQGFDDARLFEPWFYDSREARRLVHELGGTLTE